MTIVLQEPITGSDATYTSQGHIANPTRVALDTSIISGGNAIGQVEVIDGTYGPATLDPSTYATNTIDYEHHEIHDGNHYLVCGFEILNSGLSITYSVLTPNTTQWAHMRFSIEGTSQTEMYIYEGAVGSGPLVTSINNNRNSINTSSLDIFKNGSISVQGDLIYQQSKGLAGATPAAATSVGLITRANELMLKSGTMYTFDIKSVEDDNIVSYCGEWYEHTNKEIID